METKWTALINSSMAMFMAFANYNMIIIALPAIFSGIGFNPTNPDALVYLMWLILGYMIVTSALVVTFGKISDMYGRTRFYTMGFGIFTVASLLLASVTSTGNTGMLELILFRILQGVGGGFLMVNSSAILTDYFPKWELGKALGLNQVSGLVGSVVGLILGGVLSEIDWRLIFLVNVPVGILGTLWSWLTLKDKGVKAKESIDVLGNLLFGSFLVLLLVSVTFILIPYGGADLGFGNPMVFLGIPASFVLLALFVIVEKRAKTPLFDLSLFKIRDFAVANFTNVVASLGRQGITITLVLLLQAIWLPIHGYPFSSTPFWSGIFLIPNMLGFAVFGPISGWLSDRYGSKTFTFAGLMLSALGFGLLYLLPVNFPYWEFSLAIFLIGGGMGLFNSPNLADIMSSVGPELRGRASGIRAALGNTASTVSVAFYMAIIITGMSTTLNQAINQALGSLGLDASVNISAPVALFSALLGYNPMSGIASSLPPSVASKLSSPDFFANAIAPSFFSGLHDILAVSIVLLVFSAILSAMREGRARKEEVLIKRVE